MNVNEDKFVAVQLFGGRVSLVASEEVFADRWHGGRLCVHDDRTGLRVAVALVGSPPAEPPKNPLNCPWGIA